MFCANCGSVVDENENFCKVCGARIERENTNSEMNDAVQETVAPVAPVIPETPETPVPEKSSKKGKIIGIIAIIVVVLAACVGGLAISSGGFSNVWYKYFASPEAYFKHVVSKETDRVLDSASASVSGMTSTSKDKVASTIEMEVEAGEELRALMGRANDAMGDLETISVVTGVSVEDGFQNLQMKGKINGGDIITINSSYNIEKDIFYLQIPELSDKYLDFSGVFKEMKNSDEYAEMMEQYMMFQDKMEDLRKESIDFEKLLRMFQKYLNICYDNVNDVDKSKEKMRVDGISQKCTVLEATIDDDYFYDVAKDILKELADDKEIQTILKILGDVEPEEYKKTLEEALDELDKDDFYMDGKVKLALYLNGKSEIVGFKLDLGEEGIISLLCPKKGNKTALEFTVEIDDEEVFVVEGSCTEKKDVLNGTYKISIPELDEGEDAVTIKVKDFDLKAAEKGQMKGKLELSTTAAEELENYKLVVAFESNSASRGINVSILSKNLTLATVKLKVSPKSDAVTLNPSKKEMVSIDDEDEFMNYLAEIDINKFIEKAIDKSGLDISKEDLEDLISEIANQSDPDDYDDDYDYDYDYDYDDDYSYDEDSDYNWDLDDVEPDYGL